MTPKELTNETVKILDKKKAIDITAIKTDELTIVSDYFVIATGTSNTHVKSLADDLEYEMGKLGVETAVAFLNDGKKPESETYVPVKLITPDTLPAK